MVVRYGVNLTQPEKNQIVELREEGYTLLDIAVTIGCAVSTVKRVLRQNTLEKTYNYETTEAIQD